MPDVSQMIVFLCAAVLLNITPGTDVLYIASRTLGHSKKHGVVAAIGISSGLMIHIAATVFGVAEIFEYSPMAFLILKLGGVIYLGYLAWKSFFAEDFTLPEFTKKQPINLSKSYWGGVLTTILNPKIILFFLTFLPQFVDSEKGNFTNQILFLGSLFILSGTIVNVLYAYFLSCLKDKIHSSKKLVLALQRLTGVLFASFACKLVFAENR